MLRPIDPESMKGKLFLLFMDKLIIGAILACAFVVYDLWKTEENRKYNEVIQQAQDEFRRAQFVKELLPIVLERQQNTNTRIEVLGSLIRTESIDPSSAISIALSLLHESALVLEGDIHPEQQMVEALLRTLSPVLPAGLPQILDAYDYYGGAEAPRGYKAILIDIFEV